MATLPPSASSTPETPTLSWGIEHEVLVAGALRVAVQRIGIGYWQPQVRLRSWGVVPLHREGNAICVPCSPGEALWLGAWLEDGNDAARVRLRDPLTGGSAMIALPPDGQLTALDDVSHTPQPLTLNATKSHDILVHWALGLELDFGKCAANLELILLMPGEWASRSARTPPAPRVTPPPLPPRLG